MSTTDIDNMLASAEMGQEVEVPGFEEFDEAPETDVDADESSAGDDSFEDSDSDDTDDNSDAQQDNDSESDEYGNTRKKEPRMYTEEEVNRMMRDRNARGRYREEQQQTARQEPQKQESQEEADWRKQLEDFVRETVKKEEMAARESQARAREAQIQAEFESKFETGMSAFDDFREVVGSQPIDDAMVMAIRAMKNPAAFLYAASKNHSQELHRISQLDDPYSKAVEIGRLEERMRKSRPTTSKAPKPIAHSKGASKVEVDEMDLSIEEMIARDERKRLKQLREGRRR